MIYYEDAAILVRDMLPEDAQVITSEEIAQGWRQSIEKYEMRLRHRAEGRSVALIAEYRGNAAGYVNLYLHSEHGPFEKCEYPEIVDFGVLEKYRNRGVGTKLMDIAETLAADISDTVCLSVGLHSGYGNAQRLYVKRGYLPDGSGVWYCDEVCPQNADCRNDDELVLYLSKKLR